MKNYIISADVDFKGGVVFLQKDKLAWGDIENAFAYKHGQAANQELIFLKKKRFRNRKGMCTIDEVNGRRRAKQIITYKHTNINYKLEALLTQKCNYIDEFVG